MGIDADDLGKILEPLFNDEGMIETLSGIDRVAPSGDAAGGTR